MGFWHKLFISKKLKQGKWYPFVFREMILLADNSEYMVMEDTAGMRHLLPSCYYKLYEFQKGQTIRCKVDKISCSGKIYLEPQHPFYHERKKYPFTIYGQGERINKKTGRKEYFLKAKDTNGFNGEVNITGNAVFPSFFPFQCQCKLIRIKKGKLLLEQIEK